MWAISKQKLVPKQNPLMVWEDSISAGKKDLLAAVELMGAANKIDILILWRDMVPSLDPVYNEWRTDF